MLHKAKSIKGFKLAAADGEIGNVRDVYFDDNLWTVRYLVTDMGGWLTGRQVLISPYAIENIDAGEKHLATNLTKQQIEQSPPLEADQPVSRQYERSYYSYYGWPVYWYGPYAWGPYYYPTYMPGEPRAPEQAAGERQEWDAHLRSIDEIDGYHIHARDGDIGHIEDFLFDDRAWTIRYLLVDTTNLWPGKDVLVPPQWAESISWAQQEIYVSLDKDTIKQAPEYKRDTHVDREYEQRLHDYYQREGYWARETSATR